MERWEWHVLIKCEEVDELLAAYALDALTQEEKSEVAEHLGACDKHPEAAELIGVAGAIALAAPEREPPPGLKARIMAQVHADAAQQPAAADTATGFAGRIRAFFRSSFLGYAVSGAAVVAVIVAAVWFGLMEGDDNGETTYALSGEGDVSGELTIADDVPAFLTAEGLDSLTEDETYQVWAIDDQGTPTSAGFLAVTATGLATAIIQADLSEAASVAVTVEPAGGSPQPTSDPILSGDL